MRYRVRGILSEAAERTKREHLRKVRQGIVAVVETIAPGQEDETWAELTRSGILDAQFNAGKKGRMQIEMDHSIHALAAAYRQSEARVTKMQILSIIVDICPQRKVQDLLPEITKYQLFQAKKHLISYGRGQPLPAIPKYRVSVTLSKIDHFIGFISSPHFVQDVAHGTRTLKLSSGETISMPNVVRNMVAARIIKQYVSYCKEITFNHLSERELYWILKYCPTQQKKALQRLDNISADGLCGVEKLESVIRKLGERGKSSEWVTGVINILMAFKSYLKDSYRLHVSTSSRCPNHCSTFALSDPSEPEFSEQCDHYHDLVCNDCKSLYHLESLMRNAFSDPEVVFYSNDEKEDKLHDVQVSLESIHAWKRHLLRAVHQDRARQEALDEVDSSKVFIMQDFAMKFLPRRFKETQMEWFGKRGISWHISHCVRRTSSNECEVSVYSHLFRQSISQSSEVVAAVMFHTLQEEKTRHPEIKEAFYRSDCAGSYASGGLLVPIRHIGRLTGISIKRYDFSEPQAGKGPCDRSSAHQKSHVNRFLNEGNDVMTAEQVKRALESHGGVQSVVPYVVEYPESASKCPTPRIPDVSLLHNYQYCNDGLKVWKAYNIGTRKLVAWLNLDKDGKILPSEIRIIESGPQGNRESIKKDNTCFPAELSGPAKPVGSPEESGDEDRDCGLFSCPEPGCVKQYITMGRLEKQIAAEKHSLQDVSEPLGDKVIKKWAEQFQQVTSKNLSSQLKNNLSSLRLTEDLSVTTH